MDSSAPALPTCELQSPKCQLLEKAAHAHSTDVRGKSQCRGQNHVGQGPMAYGLSVLPKGAKCALASMSTMGESAWQTDELFPSMAMGTLVIPQ